MVLAVNKSVVPIRERGIGKNPIAWKPNCTMYTARVNGARLVSSESHRSHLGNVFCRPPFDFPLNREPQKTNINVQDPDDLICFYTVKLIRFHFLEVFPVVSSDLLFIHVPVVHVVPRCYAGRDGLAIIDGCVGSTDAVFLNHSLRLRISGSAGFPRNYHTYIYIIRNLWLE